MLKILRNIFYWLLAIGFICFFLYIGIVETGARRNLPVAQSELGRFYYQGFIFYPKDNLRAKTWLLPAARHGNPNAQLMLGLIFEEDKNYEQSAYWYLRAAIQNVPEAQNNFAVLYSKGLGIEKNPKKAFVWFRKAAENKNPYAQYTVGLNFISGELVQRNIDIGLSYIKKSAEQNNRFAQGYLALLYLKGEVVGCDFKQAEKWALAAKANNDAQAQNILDILEEQKTKKGVGYDCK